MSDPPRRWPVQLLQKSAQTPSELFLTFEAAARWQSDQQLSRFRAQESRAAVLLAAGGVLTAAIDLPSTLEFVWRLSYLNLALGFVATALLAVLGLAFRALRPSTQWVALDIADVWAPLDGRNYALNTPDEIVSIEIEALTKATSINERLTTEKARAVEMLGVAVVVYALAVALLMVAVHVPRAALSI